MAFLISSDCEMGFKRGISIHGFRFCKDKFIPKKAKAGIKKCHHPVEGKRIRFQDECL